MHVSWVSPNFCEIPTATSAVNFFFQVLKMETQIELVSHHLCERDYPIATPTSQRNTCVKAEANVAPCVTKIPKKNPPK